MHRPDTRMSHAGILSCFLLLAGTAWAGAQSPAASPVVSPAPGSGASPLPEISLAPGATEVKVGAGMVLVHQTGVREVLRLTAEQRAAASEALGGKTIAIVPPSVPGATIPEGPDVKAAIAGVKALGAKVVECPFVSFAKRAPRCGKKPLAGIIAFNVLPDSAVTPPRKQIRGGLAVVNVYRVDAPEDGTVRVTQDPATYGLTLGRAAGAWAAEHWPTGPAMVRIVPWPGTTPGSVDPFSEAVRAGILEAFPSAQFTAPDDTSWTTANLFVGQVFLDGIAVPIAANDFGVPGEPYAVFPITCPDPTPEAAAWLIGCIDFLPEDVGLAAVEAIARLHIGASVPADVIADHEPRMLQ